MARVQDVVNVLNKIAPLKYSEKWDNTGLLVEPYTQVPVKKIFLTNDLTEDVLEEAIEGGANFIISYHPPIFEAWKQLSARNVKQRIIIRAIENKIAVYSPHTALDSSRGGINDWLGSAFGPSATVKPLKYFDNYSAGVKLTIPLGLKPEAEVLKTLSDNKIEASVSQGNIQVLTSKDKTVVVAQQLKKLLEVSTVQVTELLVVPDADEGVGRVVQLASPIQLDEAIALIKKFLGLTSVRVARSEQPLISSIAICAGAGGSVVRGNKADLIWTGEMSHHEVLAAVAQGTSVILCEHSNTERGYLKSLAQRLTSDLSSNEVQVAVSTRDADPLVVV